MGLGKMHVKSIDCSVDKKKKKKKKCMTPPTASLTIKGNPECVLVMNFIV